MLRALSASSRGVRCLCHPTLRSESRLFATDPEKAQQWRSFLSNVRAPAQQSLVECVAAVHAFVWPPCAAIATRRPFTQTWSGTQWV